MGLRQISLFFLRWRYEGLARRPKGKPKRQSRATPSEAKLTIRCESCQTPELLGWYALQITPNVECFLNRKNASRVCVGDAPCRLALFYEYATALRHSSVVSCAWCASLSQCGINGFELRALKKLHHREKNLLKGVMFSGFMFIFATSDGDLFDFRVTLSWAELHAWLMLGRQIFTVAYPVRHTLFLQLVWRLLLLLPSVGGVREYAICRKTWR